MNVLIRCDGSPENGLGHVVRCLTLADELHDVHDCHITFAMRTGPLGIKMVKEKDYEVLTPPKGDLSFDYREWLNECARNVEAKVLILDVRDGLQRTTLDELRKEGILIVTIDDPENKRLSADLVFCLPVPQVKRVDWTGFSGEPYVGWEWVILRKEFSHASCPKSQASGYVLHTPKVLVTMGGSDPHGMTLKVVKAMERLDEDFEVVVVLGAGFQHKKEFGNLLSNCKRRFDVRENVQNMAEIMAQSDLAVASFGVTAYELAAMGVPAIYLCLTEDHAESASAFVEEGMAVCLDVFPHVTKTMLAEALRQLLNDAPKRSQMADRARQQVDGQGVERVARMISLNLAMTQIRKGS